MQTIIIRISLILCALILLSLTGTAYASPGLTVKGTLLESDVSPGEIITHDIEISLSADKQPVNIKLEVKSFGQNPDGTCNPLNPDQDINAYSACSYITLDKYTFRLNPGESQIVKASIHVPAEASDGGKYAVIQVSNQPDDTKLLGVAVAINIPILLTLKNDSQVHTGSIESVNIGQIVNHKPIEIYADYINTGNQHYKIKGIMHIKDNSGNVLDMLYSNAGINSILPVQLRRIKFSFIPAENLPPGSYTIEAIVLSEENQILAEKETTLDITEFYEPPVPAAHVIIKPFSAVIIQTVDEQIKIGFPAGSVTAEAYVSLTLLSKDQLPEAPKSYKLGETCFRIDGLTGLLVKDATLAVYYTEADLYQAGGDASRLRLARWDEATNQWILLDTKINAKTMTLTADTNYLSTLAVMANESVSNNGIITTIVIGIVVFVSIPTVILITRKLRH